MLYILSSFTLGHLVNEIVGCLCFLAALRFLISEWMLDARFFRCVLLYFLILCILLGRGRKIYKTKPAPEEYKLRREMFEVNLCKASLQTPPKIFHWHPPKIPWEFSWKCLVIYPVQQIETVYIKSLLIKHILTKFWTFCFLTVTALLHWLVFKNFSLFLCVFFFSTFLSSIFL